MLERHLRGMQEHPLEPFLAKGLVEREVAILVVAQHRMAEVGEVHADLVRAPGEELGFEQAVFGPALDQAKDRLGLPPFVGYRDAALALARHAPLEGEAHALHRAAKAPRDSDEV